MSPRSPRRGCLPACRRHHSVVYGRTLPPSSLAFTQTDPGAGYGKIMNRLMGGGWIMPRGEPNHDEGDGRMTAMAE